MSETGLGFGKFTPYGLNSIDGANSLVLKAISEHDWEGLTDALRILAYTTGDAELTALADGHIRETERKRSVMQIGFTGLGVTNKFVGATKSRELLKERNFQLYQVLRAKMKAKGYLEWTGVTGKNPFPKHIKVEPGEDKSE